MGEEGIRKVGEGTKAGGLERRVPFGTSSQDGCEKAGTALGYQRRNGCKALW